VLKGLIAYRSYLHKITFKSCVLHTTFVSIETQTQHPHTIHIHNKQFCPHRTKNSKQEIQFFLPRFGSSTYRMFHSSLILIDKFSSIFIYLSFTALSTQTNSPLKCLKVLLYIFFIQLLSHILLIKYCYSSIIFIEKIFFAPYCFGNLKVSTVKVTAYTHQRI
jgi:hypothetical protein